MKEFDAYLADRHIQEVKRIRDRYQFLDAMRTNLEIEIACSNNPGIDPSHAVLVVKYYLGPWDDVKHIYILQLGDEDEQPMWKNKKNFKITLRNPCGIKMQNLDGQLVEGSENEPGWVLMNSDNDIIATVLDDGPNPSKAENLWAVRNGLGVYKYSKRFVVASADDADKEMDLKQADPESVAFNFQDLPGTQGLKLTNQYEKWGVTFEGTAFGLVIGKEHGDPGNWSVTGTNGGYSYGFNGYNQHLTMSLSRPSVTTQFDIIAGDHSGIRSICVDVRLEGSSEWTRNQEYTLNPQSHERVVIHDLISAVRWSREDSSRGNRNCAFTLDNFNLLLE